MEVENLTPKKPLVVVVTIALMLVSLVLMMFDLEAGTNIVIWMIAMTSQGPVNGKAIGTILAFILGAAGVCFIAFSVDYNLRHAGEKRSLQLIGISIGIQAAVALIGLVIL